mmetsp:Transcript_1766/g.4586  ORF Transcript_1766/g.4586 Transcript_1766/m.4586 type:complete len:118 (+) Transcript_1766:1596-1949(+)
MHPEEVNGAPDDHRGGSDDPGPLARRGGAAHQKQAEDELRVGRPHAEKLDGAKGGSGDGLSAERLDRVLELRVPSEDPRGDHVPPSIDIAVQQVGREQLEGHERRGDGEKRFGHIAQ